MKRNVIKYLLSNTISNGTAFFSRWLLNYGLSRFISLSEFGVFSFISSLSNLFKSVLSFGGQLFLIYKVSKEKERKYYYLIKSAVLSIIISFIISTILFFFSFLNQTFININYFLFAVLLASFMVLIQNTYSFFKAVGLFEREALGYFLYLFAIILLFFMLYYNFVIPSLFVALTFVLFFQFLLFVFSTCQLYRFYKLDESFEEIRDLKTNMKSFIKERLPYGFHELQSAIYLNAIIIIMGFLVKDDEIAIYRSIQLIIVPISIFPIIFSQVLLKQLSANIDNTLYFRSLFRKFLLIAIFLGLCFFILFYFYGDQIINLFYANKFMHIDVVYELLLIFSFTYLFRFVSANYGVLITAMNKQNIRVYATSALILVTIFSTIFLTKNLGIVGAAYANAVSYLFIMLVYVLYSEFKLLN